MITFDDFVGLVTSPDLIVLVDRLFSASGKVLDEDSIKIIWADLYGSETWCIVNRNTFRDANIRYDDRKGEYLHTKVIIEDVNVRRLAECDFFFAKICSPSWLVEFGL